MKRVGQPSRRRRRGKSVSQYALQANTRTQCCTVIAGSEGSMVVMVVYAYARVRTYLALSRYPEKLLEVLILKHQEFSVCCLVSHGSLNTEITLLY